MQNLFFKRSQQDLDNLSPRMFCPRERFVLKRFCQKMFCPRRPFASEVLLSSRMFSPQGILSQDGLSWIILSGYCKFFLFCRNIAQQVFRAQKWRVDALTIDGNGHLHINILLSANICNFERINCAPQELREYDILILHRFNKSSRLKFSAFLCRHPFKDKRNKDFVKLSRFLP